MITTKKIVISILFAACCLFSGAWFYHATNVQLNELSSNAPEIEIIPSSGDLGSRSENIDIIPYSSTDLDAEAYAPTDDEAGSPDPDSNNEVVTHEQNYRSSFLCELSSFQKTSLCSTIEGQIDFIDRVNSREANPSGAPDASACPTCNLPGIAIVGTNDQVPTTPQIPPQAATQPPAVTPSPGTPPPAVAVQPKPLAPPVIKPPVVGSGNTGNATNGKPSPETAGSGSAPGGTAPPAPPPPTADNGSESVEDPSYETCDASNDYLERQFNRHATDNTFLKLLTQSRSFSNEFIKDSCFITSMKAAYFSKTMDIYGDCSAGQNSIRRRQICKNYTYRVKRKKVTKQRCHTVLASANRACISERYVNTVKNSFDIVTDCLKGYLTPSSKFPGMAEADIRRIQNENALSVFSLLSIESGLHINSVSSTGAAGLGQLVGKSIDAMSRLEVPAIKQFLTRPESSNVCKNVDRLYLKEGSLTRGDTDYNCDRISLSRGQPLVGLIYSYAHIKNAEIDITDFLKINGGKRWNKFNLNAKDMDRLVMSLALWAHNTGSAGLTTPLNYLLNTKYAKTKVTNLEKFLSELKDYMGRYPHPETRKRGRGRINETMNYFGKIAKVEKEAGEKCLVQK